MDVAIIVGLILFALATFLVFKLIKKVVVASITVFLICLLVTAGLGFFAYKDITEIQSRLIEDPSLVLVNDVDQIIAGFVFNPSGEEQDDKLIALNDIELNSINELLITDYDIDKIHKLYDLNKPIFKIFKISLSTFETAPFEEAKVQGYTLKKSNLIDLLKSENPTEKLITSMIDSIELENQLSEDELNSLNKNDEFDIVEFKEMIKLQNKDLFRSELENQISEFATSDAELKAYMSAAMFIGMISDDQGDALKHLFSEFKDGGISVEPETITFSILSMSPKKVFEYVIDEVDTQNVQE